MNSTEQVNEDPQSVAESAKSASSSERGDARASFDRTVYELKLDALMCAARAKEYAVEWLVAGLALAVLYMFAVVVPRGAIVFIDCVIVFATAGGGAAMLRFEWRRGRDFVALLDDLHKEPAQR